MSIVVPEWLLDVVQPWASLYSETQGLSLAVVFLHLAALMIGGGRAVTIDHELLRSRVPRPDLFARLSDAHRVVVGALTVSVLTGALMTLADLEHFAQSSAYRLKLAVVAFLLVNGLWMRAVERQSAGSHGGRAFVRLRVSAFLSASLWLLTLLAGCWLQVA